MKFETKFNLEEHAWFMEKNKPTEVIIASIRIFYVNTNQDKISYTGKDVKTPVTWLDHQNLFEDMLFKTKEELLNSL
jgi:hypothetical protein